jgi:hypothetical protein
MKRIWIGAALALPLAAFAGCTVDAPPPPDVTSTGGAGVVGGSGTTQPMGGNVSNAGSGVTGGAPAGGMSGSGPQGGSGGMSGASTGGMSGSSAGGSGGSGGSGPAEPTLAEVVGKLDGRLMVMKCNDQPNGDDCQGSGAVSQDFMVQGCPNGQLNIVIEHDIGGVPGQMYLANMHFYGVMEPKNYGNNQGREAGNTHTQPSNGMPIPFHVFPTGMSYLASNYNTYELHVYNEADVEVGTYFLNSDTQEGHYTFALSYDRDIPIVGGGRVVLRIYDQNCRMIKNCGPNGGSGAACATNARTVDVAGAEPAPGGALVQPGLGNPAQHSGQWLLIDVTGIQKM